MPSRVASYISLRRWESDIARRLFRAKNPNHDRDSSIFHYINPSQMGIIVVSMILFGVDFVIAIGHGTSHVTGVRKQMVSEAAEAKHEALQKKAMLTDYMKANREGKGFVLSDAAK
jgi:hypothetical protein